MAVYSSKIHTQNGETVLEEQYIYGMDRVGSINKGVVLYDNEGIPPVSEDLVENTLGQKRYELKNHLGTVNVTISDRKVFNTDDNHYEAVVMSYVETYAFGMFRDACFSSNEKLSRTNPDKAREVADGLSGVMPGRSYNADGQRFLYHGMEHDLEVSGNGNSYTTEFRQYSLSRCMFSRFLIENRSKTIIGNPRLGRWKSLDPLMSSFPHISPYVGFANNPIYFTDPYGLAPTNRGGEPEGENPPKYTNPKTGAEYEYDGTNWVLILEELNSSAKRTFIDRVKGFVRKTVGIIKNRPNKSTTNNEERSDIPMPLPTDRYDNYDPLELGGGSGSGGKSRVPFFYRTFEGDGDKFKDLGYRVTGGHGSSTTGTKDESTNAPSFDGSGFIAPQYYQFDRPEPNGETDERTPKQKAEPTWEIFNDNFNYEYQNHSDRGVHIIRVLGADTIYERRTNPNLRCAECSPKNRSKTFGEIFIGQYEKDGTINRDKDIKY